MKRMRKDIDEIADLATEMGDLALFMLERSVKTLDREDMELVENMKKLRVRIQQLDEIIETKAFRVLMIYQPMAADMRAVATMLKMTTYFERIGKYGYNIAQYSVNIKDGKASSVFRRIMEMGELAVDMVKDAMDAFKTKDISKLKEYTETENKLDGLRGEVLEEAIVFMKDHPDRVDDGSMIISASRYLERAGDYACKLAEKIMFMVTGERIVKY